VAVGETDEDGDDRIKRGEEEKIAEEEEEEEEESSEPGSPKRLKKT